MRNIERPEFTPLTLARLHETIMVHRPTKLMGVVMQTGVSLGRVHRLADQLTITLVNRATGLPGQTFFANDCRSAEEAEKAEFYERDGDFLRKEGVPHNYAETIARII